MDDRHTKRIRNISSHLLRISPGNHDTGLQEVLSKGVVELSEAPPNMQKEYQALITPQAIQFVAEMVNKFDPQVSEILSRRQLNKLHFQQTNFLPDFVKTSSAHQFWRIRDIPKRLQDRRIDLGDITPANTGLFEQALNSSACGIQADFDDGHCPTWANQLKGLFNVYQFVHGSMTGVPPMSLAPLVILRPRAWNMLDHNMMVEGKVIPGALFDFGLHIFHNGKKMFEHGDGPFFYLPKLESHLEVRLWNNIFSWAESQLGLPLGSIKACVLIESILTSFELEQVLFELRDHCAGLNCGMWDYSASFVSTFGHRKNFILADRKKYISMDKQYLKSYLELVIKTCHAHGCHATGGMVPSVLPKDNNAKSQQIVQNVCRAKLNEIQAGADGFLVFDPDLIKPLLQVWRQNVPTENQLHVLRQDLQVNAVDLLTLPQGGFTLDGLRNNITVGVLFIQAWLRGVGSFILNGAVEDSATAEISRSQIWQAVRHQCILENDGRKITRALVKNEIAMVTGQLIKTQAKSPSDEQQLTISAQILEELILASVFPQFITTYLYEHHEFIHSKWR